LAIVVINTKNDQYKLKHLFGVEMRVADIRQASKILPFCVISQLITKVRAIFTGTSGVNVLNLFSA
jgi:hypothetical protein